MGEEGGGVSSHEPYGGGGGTVRKIVRGPENSDKWIL